MKTETIEQLFKKAFGGLIVFLLERSWRSVAAWIFIIIVAPPFLEFTHETIKKIPYAVVLSNTSSFLLSNFNYKDLITFIFNLLLLSLILYLKKQQKVLNEIDESFENLRKWNIPLNSHWQTEKTNDRSTKSLAFYSSYVPGLLKPAYNWYDYTLTFSAKFTSQFWVIVRATNNQGGVAFKITNEDITPYIIYEGNYICDKARSETFPTLFKNGQWTENLTVKVEGNVINISTKEISYQYRIQSRSIKIKSDDLLFFEETNMSDLERSDKDINDALKNWSDIYAKLSKATDSTERSRLQTEYDAAWKKYSDFNSKIITLDYQMGSIGFKNDSNDVVYINNLRIKKNQ